MTKTRAMDKSSKTLWDITTYALIKVSWFVVFVATFLLIVATMRDWGFGNVAAPAWYTLVALAFVLAIPVTAFMSSGITELREWMKSIEIIDHYD